MSSAARITSADIRKGMLTTWAAPEYAIMWEVGDATGARHTRFADAVIMSLWPSRGLELHGVEIKVSRSDWRREAADPKKAETIAAFCDRWWVHTAPGVILDLAEVPVTWGWREFDGKRWTTRREASLNTEVKATTRQFLAALLRRADEGERLRVREAADRWLAADREAIEKRISDEVERRTRHNTEASKIVAAFEAETGLSMTTLWAGGEAGREVGALVKVIRDTGLLKTWESIVAVQALAEAVSTKLRTAIDASPLPFAKPIVEKRRRAAA